MKWARQWREDWRQMGEMELMGICAALSMCALMLLLGGTIIYAALQ